MSGPARWVTAREINAGTDWGSWWANVAPMLEQFFAAD